MASVVTDISTFLLILIVQGYQGLVIEHEERVNATVGQNISLPCIIISEEQQRQLHISQIEWHKDGETGSQKLVVFNPSFSPFYHADVKLQVVHKEENKTIQGSILLLYGITEEDQGNYVCEISTFPSGSLKRSTKLQVTEPKISVKAVSTDGPLIEGDEVNITCTTHPPADGYRLHSSKSNLSLESQSGQFTIENVTRQSSVLICWPLWTSSNQHLESLRDSVQLTVDFLDDIECNSSSQIEVEPETNLTITCDAKSSTSTHYIWTKGSITVSQDATISLWSLNPEHSGIYSVIVRAGNHSRLWTQRDFLVTVLNRTQAEHQSSTVTMETRSQITDSTSLTTAQLDTSTVSQAGHVSTAYRTSTRTELHSNTTTPSAGNVTASHANITAAHAEESGATTSSQYASTEEGTVSVGCCQWQNITSQPGSTREGFSHTHPNTSTTNFMSTPKSKSTTETKVQDRVESKSHVVYVLIPFFLLLVLIAFLYRRYIIQKRMDMPPPFKPPPPPVKYTSVRSQGIPVTDILV